MSELDPSQLKVVELRSELSSRGLDTKGNKAALVERLKEALKAGDRKTRTSNEKKETKVEEKNDTVAEEKKPPEEKKPEVDGKNEAKVEEPAVEEHNEEEHPEEEEEAEEEVDEEDGDEVIVMEVDEDDESQDVKDDDDQKNGGDADRSKKRKKSGSDSAIDTDGEARSKHQRHEEEPDTFDDTLVALDKYNSDLNLLIDKTRYGGRSFSEDGFAFMWAGAKATYGVKSGKICYEVKVIKNLELRHLPKDEPNPHVLRAGFSTDQSSTQLGEDETQSYGYDGTGKAVSKNEFKEYGSEVKEGEVVSCFLNMDADPIQISFAKNGEHLGVAYEVSKEELGDNALYPHILVKNCSYEVNFGQKEEPFFPLPEDYSDYVFIYKVPLEERVRATKGPEKREECEVIMLCGLPGSGKTTWAIKFAAENADKRYNILGTSSVIDKMKVMGTLRKQHYTGKWYVLVEKAAKCVKRLTDIASRVHRNYILDQTNVYSSAQRRKMRPFEGFKRKAVVIVPTDEEFKRRCEKRDKEEAKDIPSSAVLEMKANFSLPSEGSCFDEVEFIELSKEEAEPIVKKYNEEGRAAAPPPRKRFRDDGRRRQHGGYYGPNRGPPRRYGDNRSPNRFRDRNPGSGRSWGRGGPRPPPKQHYRQGGQYYGGGAGGYGGGYYGQGYGQSYGGYGQGYGQQYAQWGQQQWNPQSYYPPSYGSGGYGYSGYGGRR